MSNEKSYTSSGITIRVMGRDIFSNLRRRIDCVVGYERMSYD